MKLLNYSFCSFSSCPGLARIHSTEDYMWLIKSSRSQLCYCDSMNISITSRWILSGSLELHFVSAQIFSGYKGSSLHLVSFPLEVTPQLKDFKWAQVSQLCRKHAIYTVALKVETFEADRATSPANSVELHLNWIGRDADNLDPSEVRAGHKVACVIKRTWR